MSTTFRALIPALLCAATSCASAPDDPAVDVTVAAATKASDQDMNNEAGDAQADGSDQSSSPNAPGQATTVSTSRIDRSTKNGFFHDFGTNKRVCSTCHQEALGWTLTPDYVQRLPASDPLFVFDGSDCLPPSAVNTNPVAASTLMRSKALVRVELPIPAGADFSLTSYRDPLACSTAPSAAALRMYRRPLPTSNAAFLSTVMWDGRENLNPPNDTSALMRANLETQANHATLGHAQATSSLPSATAQQIVAFEVGLFNAQTKLGSLTLDSAGAHGGARFLMTDTLPSFHIGINDVFSPGFTSVVFDVFRAWETKPRTSQAAQIGRGEVLFNTRTFVIDNVRGINSGDPADGDPVQGSMIGTCGTCHDTPNVGNHSVALAIDIGVTGPSPLGGLDVSGLPSYTFTQIGSGKTITVTDPGRGLISGRFKDIGKTKGPMLRALAARAPYFHNGAAKDLATVIRFYDQRFHIGLSDQEAADLAAFLQAL